MTRVTKNWGYEEIIHNGDYCCKALVYLHRVRSSLHYHEKKHETFVVATGLFRLEHDATLADGLGVIAKTEILRPGMFVVLPPDHIHRITCLEPGTIIEASTHDDPEDCVRLAPSDAVPL